MFSIFCDHVEMLPGEEYAGLADWSVVVVSVCPSLPSKVLGDEHNVQNIFYNCYIFVVCDGICFGCNTLFYLFVKMWKFWQLPEDSDRGFVFCARLPQLWSSHLQPTGLFFLRTGRIFSSNLRLSSLISSSLSSLSLITHHQSWNFSQLPRLAVV